MKDVIVISYPRSGLTWLRRMCHEVAKDLGVRGCLFRFTHDGMGVKKTTKGRVRRRLQASSVPSLFPAISKRVSPGRADFVFLLRDPRDVLLSNWKLIAPHDSLSKFLRSESQGIKPIVNWLLWWDKRRQDVKSFHVFRYEAMKVSASVHLDLILELLGLRSVVPDKTLVKYVEAGRIDNMRREEDRDGGFFGDVFPVGGRRIVNRGICGGWKNEFSEEDKVYCSSFLKRLNGTFAETLYAADSA